MGRELKRVPLDFDWPWSKEEKNENTYGHGVWPGYMFHHGDDCEETYTDEGGYACGKSWHEAVDPPTGPGFQLWETTSEGSPISPVFGSLDALCAWAETHATTFASVRTSASEWKRMLVEGSVETVIAPGVIAM